MFDSEYWKWRQMKPEINKIIHRHLNAIFSDLGMDGTLLSNDNRLGAILKKRGCTEEELEKIQINNIEDGAFEYAFLSSKIEFIDVNGTVNDFWGLNKKVGKDEYIVSYNIPCNIKEIKFCPQNDVDAFIEISEVVVNGKTLEGSGEMAYWRKGEAKYSTPVECMNQRGKIVIRWMAIQVEEAYGKERMIVQF